MHDIVTVALIAVSGVVSGQVKDLYALRRTERNEARWVKEAAEMQAAANAETAKKASEEAARKETALLEAMEALSEYQAREIAALNADNAVLRVAVDNIPDILAREVERLKGEIADANERLRRANTTTNKEDHNK